MKTALIIIDAQESFRHRPYFSPENLPSFVQKMQKLIDGAKARKIPVVQIFHVEDSGPFSLTSGHVKTLDPLAIAADMVFQKRRHSALVGTGLDVWLIANGISRLLICGIRTEQCCETTTRHASDLGFRVDFVTEATLTFAMTRGALTLQPDEIKARTEMVLSDRFARIVTVEEALKPAQ